MFCVTSWCLADDAQVPLETEIPEEILAGTPPDVLARLYPELTMPSAEQPPLMVPAGTVNLAKGKKVTSSDPAPLLGELSFVTDGVKEGSEDAFVELAPGLQWVQIDLEKPARVYAIYLWHYFREAGGFHDVIVQVSDDENFEKDVKTVYNNDTDASAGKGVGRDRPYIETNLGVRIDAKGVQGRYVRLYSKGSTRTVFNQYVEVEVFGKPAS
jgi:hypothetical protein